MQSPYRVLIVRANDLVSTPSYGVVVAAHANANADANDDDARSDADASASCFEFAAYVAVDDANAYAKMLNVACHLDGAYAIVLPMLPQPSLKLSDCIRFLADYSS